MRSTLGRFTVAFGLAWLIAVPALAHVTPPVVLVSDRDAVVGLLGGARRFFVREVKLSPEQRQAVVKRSGWNPDESFYRFYLGRDETGRLVGAMLFLTEYTVHGPVRVANRYHLQPTVLQRVARGGVGRSGHSDTFRAVSS